MKYSCYLLVDAGNSFCKLVVYGAENNEQLYSSRISYTNLEQLFKNKLIKFDISFIFICSVKNNQYIEMITVLSRRYWNCDIEIFNPDENKFLPSKYKKFTSLGADRWAAILALYFQRKSDFCIIDCGTAITVDYVIDNEHLGGLIGPGLNTLASCLFNTTDNITLEDAPNLNDSVNFCSSNTSDCISSASKLYFTSFIEAILVENKRLYGDQFKTYITGGDNLSFKNNKNFNIVYSQNLVIEGLFYLKNK